jgi:hypothetical protein
MEGLPIDYAVLIGGCGEPPGKSDLRYLKLAVMDLFWALRGHFAGTNIRYMGVYCRICIRIVPPCLLGDSWGLSPPECPISPPYKYRRIIDTVLPFFESISLMRAETPLTKSVAPLFNSYPGNGIIWYQHF